MNIKLISSSLLLYLSIWRSISIHLGIEYSRSNSRTHRFYKKWILEKSMFSTREKYLQSFWYNSFWEGTCCDPRARSISYGWCCYGTLILRAKLIPSTTEFTQYFQGTRIRYMSPENTDGSHWLGRAMSSPHEYRTNCPRMRTCEPPTYGLGRLDWYYYHCTLSRTSRYRIYPLGQCRNSQKISHRFQSTSYHRESSSESIFCSSWFFWVSTIFTDQCVSERTGARRDCMGIDFHLLFSYFCRQ
jgi:hypothetical protein